VQWSSELLRRNLIESEPPRIAEINKFDAVRITAAGSYYWRYLVRSFAYVDLVFVDTPVIDEALARRLADLAESSHLVSRFERVRMFLNYLGEREEEELAMIAERVGPFQEALVPAIRVRIDREIRIISRKLPTEDSQ
jgi:hypothetical protein